jgi:hypothetical protein
MWPPRLQLAIFLELSHVDYPSVFRAAEAPLLPNFGNFGVEIRDGAKTRLRSEAPYSGLEKRRAGAKIF